MSEGKFNLLECNKCQWVHFGVSEKYIDHWEKEWAERFKTMTPESRSHFGLTDRPPTREQYLQCFNCGNKDIDSFKTSNRDVSGRTIQPVLDRTLR